MIVGWRPTGKSNSDKTSDSSLSAANPQHDFRSQMPDLPDPEWRRWWGFFFCFTLTPPVWEVHIFKHPSSSHPAHVHTLAFGSVFGRRGAAQVWNGPRSGSEHSPRLSAGGRPWQQKHQSESQTCAFRAAECFCGTLETFLPGSLYDDVEQPCPHTIFTEISTVHEFGKHVDHNCGQKQRTEFESIQLFIPYLCCHSLEQHFSDKQDIRMPTCFVFFLPPASDFPQQWTVSTKMTLSPQRISETRRK